MPYDADGFVYMFTAAIALIVIILCCVLIFFKSCCKRREEFQGRGARRSSTQAMDLSLAAQLLDSLIEYERSRLEEEDPLLESEAENPGGMLSVLIALRQPPRPGQEQQHLQLVEQVALRYREQEALRKQVIELRRLGGLSQVSAEMEIQRRILLQEVELRFLKYKDMFRGLIRHVAERRRELMQLLVLNHLLANGNGDTVINLIGASDAERLRSPPAAGVVNDTEPPPPSYDELDFGSTTPLTHQQQPNPN